METTLTKNDKDIILFVLEKFYEQEMIRLKYKSPEMQKFLRRLAQIVLIISGREKEIRALETQQSYE